MLEKLKQQMRELLEQRRAKAEALTEITAKAEREERDGLNADEQAQRKTLREEIAGIDEKLEPLEERIDELEADEAANRRAEEAARRLGDPTPRVEVGDEPVTYNSESARRGLSFFVDAFRASKMGDARSQQRIARHTEEMEALGRTARADGTLETRDVGTAAFGGLIVPQYLTDEFAEVLRNGRAFANACRRLPLPDEGMSFVIPRGQTGTSTAVQATENAAVSETDADFDNDLTVPVRTIAGQQDVSRQTLERGTPGIDRLLMDDLVADYAETLDVQVLSADGTSGTHEGVLEADGINAVTYTDASPTVPEAWPKLADANQRVGTNRKLPANVIVMHTRRWGWFIASLDSQNRPLVVNDAGAAQNAMGRAADLFGEGQLVGTIQGLPVLVDANIPINLGGGTNEDRIITLRRQDAILWEVGDGMPRELRFEEPGGGNLMVKLVVYGYSAFTAERHPVGVSVISGTGLVTPTF